MVPMARIERATSPLPRECSTTELHGQTKICLLIKYGAGEGNRTLILSLEGFCSTIELHPPNSFAPFQSCGARPGQFVSCACAGGGGGWIRTNVGVANGFTVRPF